MRLTADALRSMGALHVRTREILTRGGSECIDPEVPMQRWLIGAIERLRNLSAASSGLDAIPGKSILMSARFHPFTNRLAVYDPSEQHRVLLICPTGYTNVAYPQGNGQAMNFCMLNPSTATETEDDPTVARCIKRARSLGNSFCIITNLYSYRATDPKAMQAQQVLGNANSAANDAFIALAAFLSLNVVLAWGSNAERGRALEVCELLREQHERLWCLGVNRDKQPKHPLYLSDNLVLYEYEEDRIPF